MGGGGWSPVPGETTRSDEKTEGQRTSLLHPEIGPKPEEENVAFH